MGGGVHRPGPPPQTGRQRAGAQEQMDVAALPLGVDMEIGLGARHPVVKVAIGIMTERHRHGSGQQQIAWGGGGGTRASFEFAQAGRSRHHFSPVSP